MTDPVTPRERGWGPMDMAFMDGYLAARDDDEWRSDDEILRLAEEYAAAQDEDEK